MKKLFLIAGILLFTNLAAIYDNYRLANPEDGVRYSGYQSDGYIPSASKYNESMDRGNNPNYSRGNNPYYYQDSSREDYRSNGYGPYRGR